MKITFVVDSATAGKTIKQYFEEQNLSTTEIKRFKYYGHIWANGKTVTVRYVMQLGDNMEFATDQRLQTPTFAQRPAKFCTPTNIFTLPTNPTALRYIPI